VDTLPMLPVGGRSAIAAVVAAAEAAIVPLVVLPWTSVAGLVVAAVVLAAFTVGTFMAARSQGAVPCQCFGPSSVPLGMPHAVRNALLCAAAAAGAAGVGPVAARLPGVALSLGIGAAAALPAIFLDDLTALLAGGGTASGAPPAVRRAAAQFEGRKVRE
jgi:hypothetical protein